MAMTNFFFFFFNLLDTESGKKSVEVPVRGFLPRSPKHPSFVEYAANLTVSSTFGRPGAIVITNLHKKEFYLVEIVLHGFNDGPFFFPANSWIHSRDYNPESRILFCNQVRRKKINILVSSKEKIIVRWRRLNRSNDGLEWNL